MPTRNDTLLVLPAISVTFSKPVSGVIAGNLTVDSSPATSVSGVDGTAGPYTFSGFVPPSPGVVSIALASGVIQDSFGQDFAGIHG